MKEYIEREAVRKQLKEQCAECDARFEDRLCLQCRVRSDWELIQAIPAADVVERKRGEWKECQHISYDEWRDEDVYWYTYVCSNCHFEAMDNSHFCPNCGADMRGDNDA